MKFIPFSEHINEALQSTMLTKLLASNDSDTKNVIRDIAKKDRIALSNLTDDEVETFVAWSAKDVKSKLKYGSTSDRPRKNRLEGGKRRIIGFDKDKNKIVISAVYNNGEISIDFVDNSNVKNFNQFFKEYDDIFGKLGGQREFFTWVVVDFPGNKDLEVIDKKKKDEQLKHVFKRESGELRKKLLVEDKKLAEESINLIKTIGKTDIDLSGSIIHLGTLDIKVTNKFGHDFNIYIRSKRKDFVNNPTVEDTISDLYFELNVGTIGSTNPIEEPAYFERFKILGLFGEAVIKDTKEIQRLKEIQIQMAENAKKFDEFTFELDGKIYKQSGMGGFEEIPEV